MDEALAVMRDSLPEAMVASETETVGSPSLGDVIRQGDLYLECISALPTGKSLSVRQLAPGNTQGSRHVLEGDCEVVEVKQHTTASGHEVHSALIGPAFICKGACEVTHPEHGNKVLPENTIWQVVYQQAFADEVRRVAD
jgi:hypothetical protein